MGGEQAISPNLIRSTSISDGSLPRPTDVIQSSPSPACPFSLHRTRFLPSNEMSHQLPHHASPRRSHADFTTLVPQSPRRWVHGGQDVAGRCLCRKEPGGQRYSHSLQPLVNTSRPFLCKQPERDPWGFHMVSPQRSPRLHKLIWLLRR